MSLLCNLLDISARGNHYLCRLLPVTLAVPALATVATVLVGGRARAHAHEKAASSQCSLSSAWDSWLSCSPLAGVKYFPGSWSLIPPVVSAAINTSVLLTMQCPDVTPGARCVSLVSAGLSLAAGYTVEAVTGCRSQPGVTHSQAARPATRQQHSHRKCHHFTITLGHQKITRFFL